MRCYVGPVPAQLPLCHKDVIVMADKKPATVTLKKLKGTTYVISAFYNVAAKETIFDKLEHIGDRDVNASVPVTKN